jgi:hypothetical protein
MRRHFFSVLFAPAFSAVLLVPCCGCDGTSGQTGPLLPVKGKVTYKGQPVTKGVVRFDPDGYGRPATGSLQSDGTFVLGTFKTGDGVVAGEHRVSISGFDKSRAGDRALKKYGSGKSSGLTAEVDAEHTEFNFDLK